MSVVRPPRTFKEAIDRNKEYMVDKIDPSNGLLTKLEDRKILLSRQVKQCKAKETDEERTEKMLEFLVQCPDEQLSGFCDALKETLKDHVVEKIMRPQEFPRTEQDAAAAAEEEPRSSVECSDP